MKMLVPCGACARHVLTTEETCPFCHARVKRRGAQTFSRAALLLAGAAAVAGCGKTIKEPGDAAPDASAATEDKRRAPVYGGPPIFIGPDAAPVDPPAPRDAGSPKPPKGPKADAGF